jgi:endonuclease III
MASRTAIDGWCDALAASAEAPPTIARRAPIGQLVKSLISSRTRDEVSLAALHRLKARFGSAAGIAAASVAAVEQAIAAVTFADVKAPRLVESLKRIGGEHPDFRLDHLGPLPIATALAELEQLPGVGRKTAASVLNFSTLRRPVLVVDTHVARVLGRLGLAGDAVRISETVTAAMAAWPADRFVAFHVVLKRLGQSVCRWDRPHCRRCPLESLCCSARENRRARQFERSVRPLL